MVKKWLPAFLMEGAPRGWCSQLSRTGSGYKGAVFRPNNGLAALKGAEPGSTEIFRGRDPKPGLPGQALCHGRPNKKNSLRLELFGEMLDIGFDLGIISES